MKVIMLAEISHCDIVECVTLLQVKLFAFLVIHIEITILNGSV